MARVAVPSMRRYHYADWFSTGTVAAGGALGMLVPPSGALIVYGLLTQTDVAKLFLAALGPVLASIAGLFLRHLRRDLSAAAGGTARRSRGLARALARRSTRCGA